MFRSLLTGPSGAQHPSSSDVGDQAYASLALATQIALLAATLVAGQALSKRRIMWIGEAGVALMLGLGLGLLILSPLVDQHAAFAEYIGFSKQVFFLAILPPIIFEAGLSMDVERFFTNAGAITCFALLGTFVSTLSFGLVMWGAGAAGLCVSLTFLEALLFGSVVSATDPVTVLSVFQRLGANPDLFALTFGESVLNDAVAMVLFHSLSTFLHAPVTGAAVAWAVASFLAVFVGSMAVGAGVGFALSLMTKTRACRSQHLPLESSLVSLGAFFSYMLADAAHLSGIVSVLFCGMVCAAYALPNMSRTGRDRVRAFFKLLSTLSESFVFIFIGASLFLDQQAFDRHLLLPFLGACFVALALSRAVNIWPCAMLVNRTRSPEARIPPAHTFILWWSGLRGAMAFAIGLEAAEDLAGERGELMLASIYCVVLATVLVNGGLCAHLLGRLHCLEGSLHGAATPSKHRLQDAGAASDDHFLAASWVAQSAEGGEGEPRKPPGQLSPAASKSFVLAHLNKLDQKYLGRIFLAEQHRDIELQPLSGGDMDAEEGSHLLPPAAAACTTPALNALTQPQ